MRRAGAFIVAIVGFLLAQQASAADGNALPQVDNPYCAVRTLVKPGLPEQARALIAPDGQPTIVISSSILQQRDYARFLLAHECCHHTNGHLSRLQDQLAAIGVKPFSAIAGAVKAMELEADCCAAKLLKERGELASIDAAKRSMASFGGVPTGAYYPNGIERSYVISDCAK